MLIMTKYLRSKKRAYYKIDQHLQYNQKVRFYSDDKQNQNNKASQKEQDDQRLPKDNDHMQSNSQIIWHYVMKGGFFAKDSMKQIIVLLQTVISQSVLMYKDMKDINAISNKAKEGVEKIQLLTNSELQKIQKTGTEKLNEVVAGIRRTTQSSEENFKKIIKKIQNDEQENANKETNKLIGSWITTFETNLQETFSRNISEKFNPQLEVNANETLEKFKKSLNAKTDEKQKASISQFEDKVQENLGKLENTTLTEVGKINLTVYQKLKDLDKYGDEKIKSLNEILKTRFQKFEDQKKEETDDVFQSIMEKEITNFTKELGNIFDRDFIKIYSPKFEEEKEEKFADFRNEINNAVLQQITSFKEGISSIHQTSIEQFKKRVENEGGNILKQLTDEQKKTFIHFITEKQKEMEKTLEIHVNGTIDATVEKAIEKLESHYQDFKKKIEETSEVARIAQEEVAKAKNEIMKVKEDTEELNNSINQLNAALTSTADSETKLRNKFFNLIYKNEYSDCNENELSKKNSRYNLLLMSINNISEIDIIKLKEISKNNNDKPILIKNNDGVSIYGFSEPGWKLTKLDSSTFSELTFPKGENYQKYISEDLTESMREEILSKRGHVQINVHEKINRNLKKKFEEFNNIFWFRWLLLPFLISLLIWAADISNGNDFEEITNENFDYLFELDFTDDIFTDDDLANLKLKLNREKYFGVNKRMSVDLYSFIPLLAKIRVLTLFLNLTNTESKRDLAVANLLIAYHDHNTVMVILNQVLEKYNLITSAFYLTSAIAYYKLGNYKDAEEQLRFSEIQTNERSSKSPLNFIRYLAVQKYEKNNKLRIELLRAKIALAENNIKKTASIYEAVINNKDKKDLLQNSSEHYRLIAKRDYANFLLKYELKNNSHTNSFTKIDAYYEEIIKSTPITSRLHMQAIICREHAKYKYHKNTDKEQEVLQSCQEVIKIHIPSEPNFKWVRRELTDLKTLIGDSKNFRKMLNSKGISTHLEYAIMSNLAYSSKVGTTEEVSFLQLQDVGWKPLDINLENQRSNLEEFSARAFYHPNRQELVIAFRGAIPSSQRNLKTNILSAFFNNSTAYYTESKNFIQEAKKQALETSEKLDDEINRIVLTGYSLGGWLAETALLPLLEMDRDKSTVSFMDVITFESPGCEKLPKEIKYSNLKKVLLNFNVVTYLTLPNPINTFKPYVGRVLQINNSTLKATDHENIINIINNNSIHNLNQLQDHGIKNMLSIFDETSGFPKQNEKSYRLLDIQRWPQGKHQCEEYHKIHKEALKRGGVLEEADRHALKYSAGYKARELDLSVIHRDNFDENIWNYLITYHKNNGEDQKGDIEIMQYIFNSNDTLSIKSKIPAPAFQESVNSSV